MDNLELESDSENQFSDDDDDVKSELESSEYEETSGSNNESESDEGNAGWADSMAKILKIKPKSHKSIVLSKSKKLNELKIKKEKKYDFHIEGETKPEIKEEDIKSENLPLVLVQKTDIKLSRQKARQMMRICCVKPAIADRERERAFKKIATKGVVQLFNAVKTQQKVISQKLEAAGRLDHRRERVLNSLDKRAFLDVLMGGERAKSELVDNPVKNEVKDEDSNDDEDEKESPAKKKKSWEIFKPDFLLNKKLTNWDKNQETDEEVNEDDRGNMDFDSDNQNSS